MFELDKSQKQIQKAVKAFAKGEFDKELIQELEKKREYPKAIWEKAADLGFIGIHFPEEFSGASLGIFENVIVAEEMCRKDSSMGITLTMAGYASECLLRFGKDELTKKFLPKIAEGAMLSGGAFMEPDNGADITILSTTAIKNGSEWVINGRKSFVINGGSASFYIVLCRTDQNAQPSTQGISMILVEADTEGLEAKDVGKKLGINMMPMAELIFDNVRVPLSNLIGEEGKGYDYIQKFFTESRILLAAQAVGTAEGAFDRALDYIKGREQFNDAFEYHTEMIKANVNMAEYCSYLNDISRNLKFISDLASNIAHEIIFIVDAKIVRHGYQLERNDIYEEGADMSADETK